MQDREKARSDSIPEFNEGLAKLNETCVPATCLVGADLRVCPGQGEHIGSPLHLQEAPMP
jgi:hypothetical protein